MDINKETVEEVEDYIKYQHVERLGSSEVDGITIGECYIFPKIDGTNAHVWHDGQTMRYGSRRRELTIENDNAGFMAEMMKQDNITAMCSENPGLHVFGEWLVPHSLKTYRKDAWRRFYVFDITKYEDETLKYLHYDELRDLCMKHFVSFIPPIRIIRNPTLDNIYKTLEENTFLVEDGKGLGEGVVIKNYSFRNKYGRTTWAKLVTSEFKEKHTKEMGAPSSTGTKMVEEDIVSEYITAAVVEKTLAKIKNERDGWSSKYIPQLLGTCYHELVVENIWDICKKYKQPKIDFKNLNRFCIMRIKELAPELF